MRLNRAEKKVPGRLLGSSWRRYNNGIEDLLKLYWWWGSDTADFFFDKFVPAGLSLENLEAEKKNAIGTMLTAVREGISQFATRAAATPGSHRTAFRSAPAPTTPARDRHARERRCEDPAVSWRPLEGALSCAAR
jgi:hypothetical protein